MRQLTLLLVMFLSACSQQPEITVPTLAIKQSGIQFTVIAQGELEAVSSTPIVAGANSRRPQVLSWIADQYSIVKKGDVIARFDGVPFQLEVDEAQYEMNKLLFSKLQKQREMDLSIDDFKNEEKVVGFEYLMAQKFNIDNPLLYTKIEMIDATDNEEFLEAKSKHLKVMAGHYENKSKSEIGLIESQDQLQKMKLERNKSNLEALTITAPHDGILVLEKSWDGSLPQAGKSVFPGRKIAKLPDLENMQAKIYVPEIEAVGLKEGQQVKIKLHAFTNQTFTAKVTSISKTAQPKQRDNPIKYFIVTAVINEQDQDKLLPGQRLDAVISISENIQGIAIPIQTIFRDGDNTWVYVKQNNEFIKREVAIGQCSTSQCIIESGLKDQDNIALIDPTKDKIKEGAKS